MDREVGSPEIPVEIAPGPRHSTGAVQPH
jgi:hypothetical protein